ncbi:hypothetical protein KGF54_001557 [Candida jiufengensis]|uniref:uncharacterized protein n=1 Tax=Candida jiufengensis TaxID=497108 RepID=UPI0022258BD6|nr:uncharacterized protein KGF54_001557 [Candida jiufengensis]KAI5954996.1 hypothetical protein KGF54_001557 [Candida jiufengensis]
MKYPGSSKKSYTLGIFIASAFAVLFLFAIIGGTSSSNTNVVKKEVISSPKFGLDTYSSGIAKRGALFNAVMVAGSTVFLALIDTAKQIRNTFCGAGLYQEAATGNHQPASVVRVECVVFAFVHALGNGAYEAVRSYGQQSGWRWMSGSGAAPDKRDILIEANEYGYADISHLVLPKLDFASEFNLTEAIHGTDEFGLVSINALLPPNSTHTTIADNTTVSAFYGGYGNQKGRVLLTTFDSIHTVMNGFVDYHLNSKREGENVFEKRDYEVDWVSFNFDGFNADLLKQHWTEMDKGSIINSQDAIENMAYSLLSSTGYSVPEKICAAWGESNQPGQNSILLGENYLNSYGGVDGECNNY